MELRVSMTSEKINYTDSYVTHIEGVRNEILTELHQLKIYRTINYQYKCTLDCNFGTVYQLLSTKKTLIEDIKFVFIASPK